MFALIFWPHVTIFCIFWLHECLKWILEFNSKSLFWCQSRQTFEVRAIEQRHHEFQPIHIPPHQFWPRYHSDGLSPMHVRFEFFSEQICNVEALICHFYKNIKTLTQIHFPRDAHIFRTCTIFYRQYKGLLQMRKDLVLCALIWWKFTPIVLNWIKRRKVIRRYLNQAKFGIGPMIEIPHYVKFKTLKLRILNIGTW